MNKMRYASIPACITFGPFFMTGFGGIGDDWVAYVIRIGGAAMLMAGLGLMLSIIARQQQTIERLIAQQPDKV